MISTTLHKSKCKNMLQIYLWSILRNKVMAIVYTILILCAGPGVSLILIFLQGNSSYEWSYSVDYYLTAIFANSLYPVFVGAITLIFTLVTSVNMFSYLHKKRSMDTFGAMPVTRRTMLSGRYLAGLTMISVPVLIATIVQYIIIACMGGGNAFLPLLRSFLFIIFTAAAAFSFTVFIAICCGTTADTVISTIAIGIALPICIFIISNFASSVIPGLTSLVSNVVAFATSPYLFLFGVISAQTSANNFVTEYNNKGIAHIKEILPLFTSDVLLEIGYLIIFSVVFFVLSLIFIKRRKAEAAQNGFAFKIPIYLIRFIITVAAGFTIAVFLWQMLNSKDSSMFILWFIIGSVIGCVLSHLVISVIYNRGFKRFARELISLGLSFVTVLAISAVITTGYFGSDVYVPNPEDVKSVTLYGIPNTNEAENIEDPTIISRICSVHKSITQKLHEYYAYPYIKNKVEQNEYNNVRKYADSSLRYVSDLEYADSDVDCASLTITYNMKNGTTVSRCYDTETDIKILHSKEVKQSVLNLTRTEEYKKTLQLFQIDAEKWDSVEVYNCFNDNMEFISRKQDKALLIEALKKDILSDDEFGMINSEEEYIAGIQLMSDMDDENNSIITTYGYVNDDFLYQYIYIKDTYKNTLDFLDSINFDIY